MDNLIFAMNMIKNYAIHFLLILVFHVICFVSVETAFALNDMLSEKEQTVSEVRIEIDGKTDTSNPLVELGKNLVRIQPGHMLTKDNVEKSITALKQSGIFETIHVDSISNGSGLTVLFQLKPFQLIEDINITGAFPLFEKEILNGMTLRPGDHFAPEKLAQQIEGITRILNAEGFPSPTVKIHTVENPDSGNIILHVDLQKGSPLILERLSFKGNQHISSIRLRLLMKTGDSFFRLGIPKRFRKGLLKKDIQNIVDLYRKKGFADCKIIHEIDKHAAGHVSVLIHIQEGSQYKIRFEGNEALSGWKLRRKAVGFKSGNRNDVGLKKIASAIRDIYLEAGFQQTKVRFSERMTASGKADQRIIVFTIEEGLRQVVASVHIDGNRFFTTEKLKKQMLTEPPGWLKKGYFIPQIFEDDIYAIKALYRKNGFTAPQISSEILKGPEPNTVAIKLTIDENIRTTVSSVQIQGITSMSVDTVYDALGLKTGTAFRQYMLKSDENTISELLAEIGYPHVNVNSHFQVTDDGKKADIFFTVEEGPLAKTGQIYFSGNIRTKERVLRHEFSLEPEEPFSLRRMLKSQKNLRDMNLFDSVRFNPIGLKEKWEEIQLVVDVEERKPYFFEVGLGYGTQQGFFIQSKAGDHNLFGTSKNAWIEVDASQLGYYTETGINEPRLLGSRISMNTSLFAESRKEFNQEFGTSGYGANLGFSYKLFKHLTAALNFRFEQRDQFDGDPYELTANPKTAEEFKPRLFLVTIPSLIFDTRDSAIYPKSGMFSSLSTDISKGLTKSLDNFVKYRVDARYYVTPFKRLTFAFIGRAGYIDPYGSTDNVPDDQLFFLGGITDVRGFDENLLLFDDEGDPLGGRTSIFGSIEARIDLGRNMELPIFFDTGKISGTFDEGISEGFRNSLGLGLRYITPIGPVGFLYGKNLDPKKGESSGRLHFSIGYTF